MFLHLGQDTVVNVGDIIGIFDLENTTISKITRDYLANATKEKRVINVSLEMPKSFIVCTNKDKKEIIYISQISSTTLKKRSEKFYLKL